MLVDKATDLIGNTPLLKLSAEIHGLANVDIYAKLELLNPYGSVKDKSAWNVLKDDIEEIAANGKTVIESSSGNMAKALQILCSMHSVPLRIVTNIIKVPEAKQILQLLGAEVDELPGLSECPDPNDPNDPIAHIGRIISANPNGYFHTSQFTNEKNVVAHYQMTGREILNDLDRVDFFFGGLGTTGTTQGAGSFLKEHNPHLKNIGVIASKGHLLPGIRNVDEMYEVGLFKKDFYDDIVEINSDESIDAMLTLIRRCGVLSGPTGGGGLAAALKYLRPLDQSFKTRQNVVFIVCDRVELYLSYLQKLRPELFGGKHKRGVKTLSPQQVENAPQIDVFEAGNLAGDSNTIVIDLRGALAFKAGRISGAINISPENFESMCDQGVPFSGQKTILLVCPVGEQSRRFAAHLSNAGVKCFSLTGGMTAWNAANMPCERNTVRKLASVT